MTKKTGLSLKEAIESGRPFRRKPCIADDWLNERGDGYDFTAQEVIATDWEIKPEGIRSVDFEAEVRGAHNCTGWIDLPKFSQLKPLIGKRVKVVVTVLEGE